MSKGEEMTENEFLLADRIQKIKSMNEMYNLEENAYIAFSGGKDSTVLSRLIDEALPNNKIPRVFVNTGIEYRMLVDFVKRERERDCRILIIEPRKNIRAVLNEYGYPFKSKEHSQRVEEWKAGNRGNVLKKYFRVEPNGYRPCPKILMYQINEDFKLKVSKKCCSKLKKEPMANYEKESNRFIAITGMTKEEGGQRINLSCIITDSKTGKIKRFHPLSVITEENISFIDWYIAERNIKLCELYYPPYNFKRTGCKGCPYSLDLQNQLYIMAVYFPEERKQCEKIWGKVYDEYRRIGYRLENSLF